MIGAASGIVKRHGATAALLSSEERFLCGVRCVLCQYANKYEILYEQISQIIAYRKNIVYLDPSSRTSMLLWLGLLRTSISLSYFLSNAFADGVDSLDSSKLVAEPVSNKIKYSYM